MSYLYIAAFLAGLLTVLAPCTLTLLPVMLGGSIGGNKWKPVVVSVSLGVSVFLFTLVIRLVGGFLGIGPNNEFTRYIAGGIVLFVGIVMMFPEVWEWIEGKLGLYKSQQLIEKSNEKGGLKGAVLLGFALGPVFNSCSPTYLLILSVVLETSPLTSVIAMLMYSLGLVLFLLLIGYGGRKFASKFRFAANPKGWLKRLLGVLLILTGIAVMTSLDKTFEAWIIRTGIENGFGEVFDLECLVLDCDRISETVTSLEQ